MKKIVLCFCILLTITALRAQTFKKALGINAESFEDITTTADSGYIAAGRAGGNLTATGTGFLVVKIDATFHIQWSNTYSIPGRFQVNKIRMIRGQGNKYAIVGDLSTGSDGVADRFCVFVIDAQGYAVWSKEISGAGVHNANAINLTKEGDVLVTGLRKETAGSTDSRIYAVCLKSNTGKLLWQKSYDMLGGVQAGETIIRSAPNIFIISGSSSFRLINLKINDTGAPLAAVSLKAPDTLYTQDALLLKDNNLLVTGTIAGHGSNSGQTFISKFNSTGSVVWARYTTSLNNPRLLEDENSYLLLGDDTANGSMAHYTSIIRLNTSGHILANKVLGNKNANYSSTGGKIIKTTGGGYAIAGELDTLQTNGITTVRFASLTKLTSTLRTCGGILPSEVHFRNFDAGSSSLKVTAANDSAQASTIVLTTRTAPRFTLICDGDSPSFDQQSATSPIVIAKKEGPAVIYPNPVKNILFVSGLNGIIKTLSVIDLNGRTVATASTHDSSYKWNIQQLTSGIYYLKILQDNKLVTLKFVKQ